LTLLAWIPITQIHPRIAWPPRQVNAGSEHVRMARTSLTLTGMKLPTTPNIC
jgi:hypothetical protein